MLPKLALAVTFPSVGESGRGESEGKAKAVYNRAGEVLLPLP